MHTWRPFAAQLARLDVVFVAMEGAFNASIDGFFPNDLALNGQAQVWALVRHSIHFACSQ
jgi:hypothetical protein